MAYQKLIENISDAIEEQLKQISTRYNFDYGDEFEIALCELLIKILPEKYGVCRGFAVTKDDDFAGDDIIIYDKYRFPTVRLFEKDRLDKKYEVPIESVYAYIEAKHSLILLDENHGQSLYKAYDQVNKVKGLQRDSRTLLSIDPYSDLSHGFTAERKNWPEISNPLYGAIIARNVKDKPTGKILDSGEIQRLFKQVVIPKDSLDPDLIVFGKEDLMFPAISTSDSISFESPFFVKDVSSYIHKKTENSALAIGITMLLYALDTIKLGKMPYNKIIINELNK